MTIGERDGSCARRLLGAWLCAGVLALGAPARAQDDDSTAEGDVIEEGGEALRVYRFGGLDVEGEVRSPRLLFFLDRLRAEFDRPRLPHRSFLPELVRAARDPEVFE